MSLPSIELTIVIPCYNEAPRLPRTLRETVAFLGKRPGNSEIIVVSDGSADETIQVAEKEFAKLPERISGRAIEYHPNRGKGRAVKVGMLEAKGRLVLFMDADYAVPLTDLARAEALIGNTTEHDIAIGSRALETATVLEHQSFLRERLAKFFGLIQRSYLGLKIKDTQCGFKLFPKDAANRIFREVKLTSVIFDGEVLWLAKRLGYRVVEFPVEWTHDPDTRIAYNAWRAVKVMRDMLAIPLLHVGLAKSKTAIK